MKNEVELEATQWHPYGTGFREVGERFFAPQEDAQLLVSLGRAKLAKGAAVKADEAVKAPAKSVAKTAAKSASKAKR